MVDSTLPSSQQGSPSQLPQEDSPEVLALMKQGAPVVARIAKRVRRELDASYQLEDLIAAGTLGLIQSARRFNASYGIPFEAFAHHRIHGEIINEVGRFSELKGQAYHRAVALEAAILSGGNDACEAALELTALRNVEEMTEVDVEAAFDKLMGTVATATALGCLKPADRSGRDESDEFDLEKVYEDRELFVLVMKVLDEIDPEDAAIFKRKHFEELTFQDFSDEFGLSRPYLFRRYNRVLEFVQKRMRSMDLS